MATEVKRVITIETQRSENSINSLNRDIKALKRTLGDLTIGTEEYIRVQEELASKQRTLREINSSLRAESRTTAKRLETIQKSAGSLASAYSALNAAMALVGKNSGGLDKAFLKIQSGIALAQGIGGIKDLIQEIPNLIDDFKNLGNIISSVFNKLPFNNLNTRLDEAASKIANLTTAKVPEINIKAGSSSGGGDRIAQQNQQLAQQQKTLVPLNDQWNKYIKNLKENQEYLTAHLESTKKGSILIQQQIKDYENAKRALKDLNRVYSRADKKYSKSNFKDFGIDEPTVEQLRDTAKLLKLDYDKLEKSVQKVIKEGTLSGSHKTQIAELKKHLPGILAQEKAVNEELNKTALAIRRAEDASSSWGKAWAGVKSVFSTVGWTVLISFLVGAAYKLIDYIKKLNEAKEAQKKFNQELNNSIASISSKSLSTFYELAEAYKQVGDSAERKTEFLQTYKEQIEQTGLAIDSVNEADAAFISNTDNYVNAIIARAEIDAYREQISKKTKETLEQNLELERQLASGEAKELSFWERGSIAGLNDYKTDIQSVTELIQSENVQAIKKQIEDNKKALADFVKDAVDRIDTLKTEFSALWSRPKKEETKPSGGTSTAKATITPPDDISSEYEAIWKRIQDDRKSSREKELAEVDEFYRKALELARQYGDNTTQIENAYGKERKALQDKFDKEDKDNLIKKYNEQINIIKQLSEQYIKELPNINYFHSTKLFGFQWQKRSDVEAEYNQAKENARRILEITQDRIAQENSLIDKQLETLKLTEEEKEKLLEAKAQNRKDLLAAEAQYDVSLTEATNKKKQKIWSAYSNTVAATADVFGGVADAVSAIWKEQSEVAKGFQAAQAVFNALSAANGAYSAMASIPYVGPYLGAAAAASALVTGYANVKAIYSTNSDGSNVSTSIATPAALETNPISYTKELIGDKEKDVINQPIKCFVTENDITSTQNRVKVREGNTNF